MFTSLFVVGFYPNQTITVNEGDDIVSIGIEMRTDQMKPICGQGHIVINFIVNSSDAIGKSYIVATFVCQEAYKHSVSLIISYILS